MTDLVAELSKLKTEDLIEMARVAAALEKRAHLAGPMDDDELHEWILRHLKVSIPRVSVCDGHCAPFDFLADVYFERVLSAIAMANRGGAKTFMAAIVHVLNAKFKPGCESASVGAIEAQARRAYAHVLGLLKIEGDVGRIDDHSEIETSIMLETRWKNGSRLEVLPGTKNAVNGPHPQKVHTDEVDLMDPEVYEESRNMSQTKDGIKAQDFITSTRKGAHGPMQRILDECAESRRMGMDPPYHEYTWCIFETAKPVPNCMVANPDLPEHERCGCDRVVHGMWDDGTPRSFVQVCKGRLAKSQGWIPLHDVHKTFRLDSRDVWEAQQECIKPSTAGVVFPQFSRERYGIRRWDPDPDLGPVYMSVDFGGTNPHAVNWYQLLRYDVEAEGYYVGTKRRLAEGTLVAFDEIYITEIGNTKLAEMVAQREAFWKSNHRSFRVHKRFADPQAKAARLDWATHSPKLPTVFFATRDIKEHIKKAKDLFDEMLIAFDVERCPMLNEELLAYHYPRKRVGVIDDPEIPVDDFNHCISNFRYAVANIYQLQRRRGSMDPGRPHSGTTRHITSEILKQQIPVSTGPGRFQLRNGRARFSP